MRILDIKGQTGESKILVGETLANLPSYVPVDKAIIVTDENVNKIYGKNFPPYDVIEIQTGEGIKTLATVQSIFEKLIALEADRSTMLIGIGGGIVCDITGFVASTYMRGIRFGFVSTTLLAQVDASVGGKNGVNFGGFKNMVGVFNQPEFVMCDMTLLNTLPSKEILCGFGEIVKHALIASPKMFSFLEEQYAQAVALDPDVIEYLVYESVVIKSNVVRKDETEKGERRKLNFGHTLGHAIEKVTRDFRHGEAVSLGMIFACDFSVLKGMLPPETVERVKTLLERLQLPVGTRLDLVRIEDALGMDKKREGEKINFVVLNQIGEAEICEVGLAELKAALHTLWQN